MMRTRLVTVFSAAVLALSLAGCTRPCKPGTMLVTLTFDGASADADKLEVQLVSGGKTLTAGESHTPGAGKGTLEIDFAAGYVKGATVAVTIVAQKSGATVGSGHLAGFALADSCSAAAITIAPETTGMDMSRELDMGPPAPPDMTGFWPPVTVPASATNKIDILFMVDNSPSMDAMQTQLNTQFANFLTPFSALASLGFYPDLHIGVVTSDYGAGDVASMGNCDASPGGQKGLLQSTAASGSPSAGCAGPVGSPFISYQFGASGDHGNLPGGTITPAALASTFTCMASVGDKGCGFEHQLESVYAALHNQFENSGFLRDDALLAVVFFSNEDDGSAPPTADFYNPDTAKAAMYGAFDTYRQTRFGVGCGKPFMMVPYGDSMGALTGCIGAPNVAADPSLEFDVSRYSNLFTKTKAEGGLKDDSGNVVLVAIDAPETPVSIIEVNPASGNGLGAMPTYQPCASPGTLGTTCVVRVDHSCQNSASPAFFGDPAVRLNAVVRSAQYNQVFSICGDDLTQAPDYSKALTATGNLLRTRMLGACVASKLADASNPECSVVQHVPNGDGGVTDTSLPRCDQGAPPCWTVSASAVCANVSPDGVALAITNAGTPPAGASVSISCKGP